MSNLHQVHCKHFLIDRVVSIVMSTYMTPRIHKQDDFWNLTTFNNTASCPPLRFHGVGGFWNFFYVI